MIKVTNGDIGSTFQRLINHNYPNVNLVNHGFHLPLFIVALLKYADGSFSNSRNFCLLLYDSCVICYGIIGQSFISDMLSQK